MSEAQHDLVMISSYGSSDEAEVVRWCQKCGAVVVDLEFDNRTAPGAVMKMIIPSLTKTTHCRAKK